MKPKISIIVPVYNVELYIQNFLISVNNQKFKNFELILVNDGSTDKSILIAEEYLKTLNINYKIINKENAGQSSARNVGIKNASGKWLVFPDSDDVLNSNYLAEMYYFTQKNKNIDVIICDINRVKDENIFEEEKVNKRFVKKNGKDFFMDFIMHEIEIGPYSLMIRKDILLNNKILFNEKSRYSEEFIFITNLLYVSSEVVHLKSKLYNYCLRNGSVSTGANIERIISGYNEILINSQKYFTKKNKYCKVYQEYALPRWILATARFKSNNLEYTDYLELMKKLNAKKQIRKLILFPKLKIILASIVFEISIKLFYRIFRK